MSKSLVDLMSEYNKACEDHFFEGYGDVPDYCCTQSVVSKTRKKMVDLIGGDFHLGDVDVYDSIFIILDIARQAKTWQAYSDFLEDKLYEYDKETDSQEYMDEFFDRYGRYK